MKYLKAKSLLLAAAMMLASFPLQPQVAVGAGGPTISFSNSGAGFSSTTAEVITGDEVTIKESNVSDNLPSKIILRSKNTNQTITSVPKTTTDTGNTGSTGANTSTNSAVYISPREAGERTIMFGLDFDVATGQPETTSGAARKTSSEDIYTIQAVYSTSTAKGRVTERKGPSASSDQNALGSGTPVSGEITLARNITILDEENTMVVKCIKSETATERPKFQIMSGAKGKFSGYNVNNIVATDASTSSASFTIKPQKNLVLQIAQEGGDREELLFTLHPDAIYENAPGPNGEKTYNNFIIEGTTFEISYTPDMSNEIQLSVMTPQLVMDGIERKLRQAQTGDGNVTDYVKFAAGDAKYAVTKNFELRQNLSKTDRDSHGGNFYIKWEWEKGENSDENTVTGLERRTSETWKTAIIERGQSKDRLGNVRATVHFLSKYEEVETATIKENRPAIDITIWAEGDPATVTQYSSRKGNPTTQPDKVEAVEFSNTTLPATVTMDAYQGGIDGYKSPSGPFEYTLKLSMGTNHSTAAYAQVRVISGDPEAVEFSVDGGKTVLPVGQHIDNPKINTTNKEVAHTVNLMITAKKKTEKNNPLEVAVDFYVPDGTGKVDGTKPTRSYFLKLNVDDNTPSQDSTLSKLVIVDEKYNPIYTFSPVEEQYIGNNGITIPYRYKKVKFILTLNDPSAADNPTSVMRTSMGGVPEKECAGMVVDTGRIRGKQLKNTSNGLESDWFSFEEEDRLNIPSRFTFTVPCQDPRTQFWEPPYILDIKRGLPSKEARLESIELYEEQKEGETTPPKNLLTNFNPDKTEYPLTVPYSTDNLRVVVKGIEEDEENPVQQIEITPPLDNLNWGGEKVWVKGLKEAFKNNNGVVDIVFKVTAEDGVTTKTYTVRLTQEPPSTDAALKELKITDVKDQALTYRPTFNAKTQTYIADVPYEVNQIKVQLSSNDENVSNIQIFDMERDSQKPILELNNKQGLKLNDLSDPFPKVESIMFIPSRPDKAGIFPVSDAKISSKGYHEFRIVVYAEDGETKEEYFLHIQREQASSDAMLKSLTMRDQDEQPIKTLAFHPDETEYTLRVPFGTRKVDFSPIVNDEKASVAITEYNGLIPATHQIDIIPTKPFNLKDPGEETKFEIVVTAQDGEHKMTYTVRVIRELPSDDARLKALKVDNAIDFAPLFISSKNKYTATVAEGAQGVIITATANHPGATIRIDGNVVESGKPSDLIELLEVKQKVKIEVIAEDGVTRKLYVIEFTNQNLIEKTNNADLRRLEVNDGLMTPKFKPAVTEYEVTTTEKTYSVDIVPKVDDPLAKIRVLNGTREIGDYNGNYALALVDGENPITVEVTSPDKTVVKEYNITIFRNVEEKLKTLEPLEAEDIDYENSDNPILVKIEEYPRVGASVFEELKNYPEKSIIFQGNDYSLRFDADNLNTVIPQAEIYDFRMSFTSPDEDDIYAIIGAYEANDDIIDNVVMAYFTYHGSLPGPAAFRLSLGTKYGSRTLYWHYYNQERDRIDYYGTVKSNNKGNFGVTIDHFSTYLISPKHRLAGSEDKRGVVDELGMVLEEDYELIETGGKVNPNTGEEGGRS